jgi:macrolide-specific efflux system membrane fusion protein
MSRLMTSIGGFFSLLLRRSILLVLVLVLAVIGIWKLFFSQNAEAENYLTATVERGEIQNLVTATGVLQPRDYVDVGAQVSGQLKKLMVVVGQEVKAGDLLAEIDATVYKAKVDGIRAQLLNQKAQLGDKEAQLVLAKIRFERQQNLFKDDATTKELLQTAEASYQSAGSLLKALQAQIQQTESSLRAEEANLEYARIYAPMSGTVVSITSRQGQTLNANQQAPTIMRIADLSTMIVQTQVSEADIGKLSIGMPVYFTTLGGQDYRWYSKLNRVEPTPQVTNNVVLYNALFEVPNDTRTLMTSMSTQVFFIAAQAKDILVVPASAINFNPRKTGETADKQRGGDRGANWQDRNRAMPTETTGNEKNSPERASEKNSTEKSAHSKTSTSSSIDAGDSVAASEQASRDGDDRRKNRPRRSPPIATGEIKPKPATVQIIDSKGNLTERNILVGISNRVHVQVLEGLQEGEKIVSGMRQAERPNASATSSPMGAPPPGASGARQMR